MCSGLYFPEVLSKDVILYFRETKRAPGVMAGFVPSQYDGAEALFVETYPVFLWTPRAGLLSVHGHEGHSRIPMTGCPISVLPGLLWFQQAFILFAFAGFNHQPPMPPSPMLPTPSFIFFGVGSDSICKCNNCFLKGSLEAFLRLAFQL